MPIQSTLVVLVPEAERVVRPFREHYDPSAVAGMPAHITLLYPFRPSDQIGEGVLDTLSNCFARFARFSFALTAIGRFSDVLYLAPEPDEPFRRLTLAICDCYPDTPPYGGRHPKIVPHLTVAHLTDQQRLDEIDNDFAQAARGELPIHARAVEATLMDTRSGRWEVRAAFGLG